MPRCCGGATCACKIAAGDSIVVSGSGTSQDPFVIDSDVNLIVASNSVFNLTLSGAGTNASPWQLSVAFAATARLDDLPDVNAPSPTNAQVLGWDSATGRWTARAPTTAASGSVQHDTSLTGDGSGGSPLAVITQTPRFIGNISGVAITDAGINQMVRQFANEAARSAASPAPGLNTLSTLGTDPGLVDFWDGATWQPLPDAMDVEVIGGELLALSGSWSGQRITQLVKQVSTTSDASGLFEVLETADLTLRAGVLMCQFQESGLLAFKAVVYANVDRIGGIAYSVSDGTPFAGQPVTGTVLAWVY